MAEYTENYNLKKPTQNEFYDVGDFNGNADLIDAAMKDLEDKKVDASGGEAGESVVSFTDSADPEVTSFATLISSIVSEMSLSKFIRVLKTGLSYIAPKSHAAANKDYGGATATNYGHVKLSDVYSAADPAGSAADSLGASQNALYNAYNTLNSNFDKSVKYFTPESGVSLSTNAYLRLRKTSKSSGILNFNLLELNFTATDGTQTTLYTLDNDINIESALCTVYGQQRRCLYLVYVHANKVDVTRYLMNGTNTTDSLRVAIPVYFY